MPNTIGTRHHGGLGLGLAIVKHLVELHGGRVAVDSPGLDAGATFTVELPRLAIHPPLLAEGDGVLSRTAVSRTDAGPAWRPALGGVHVLVLDDEADARRLIATVLEQCAARVTEAATVAEALTALRTTRPDIVISDIGMPGEDGYCFIAKMRQLAPFEGGETPAIALTAYARSEDRMRVESAGYQLHIAKPVDPDELVAAVCSMLGHVDSAAPRVAT